MSNFKNVKFQNTFQATKFLRKPLPSILSASSSIKNSTLKYKIISFKDSCLNDYVSLVNPYSLLLFSRTNVAQIMIRETQRLHCFTGECDSAAARRGISKFYCSTGECDSEVMFDRIRSLRGALRRRGNLKISQQFLKNAITIIYQFKWHKLPINFLLKELKVTTKSADIILKA